MKFPEVNYMNDTGLDTSIQRGDEPVYLATQDQVGGNHYKGYEIEPGYYAQTNRLAYMESNVVKYATRHKEKGGAMDIHKAIHCLTMVLQWEYPDDPQTWKRVNK